MPLSEERRKRKARELAKERGKPCNVLPHEHAEALAILKSYHDAGMSYTQLAQQIGTEKSTIQKMLGGDHRGPSKSMRRSSYDKIVGGAITWETPLAAPTHRRHGAKVSVIPAKRKLRALIAAGYPGKWLGRYTEYDQRNLGRLVVDNGAAFCYAVTSIMIDETYRKLIDVDPVDMGVAPTSKLRAIKFARRMGYVPASCWDDDTINDPEAIPEWTGECGTDEGYRIHIRETLAGRDLPPCEPCRAVVEVQQPGHRGAAGEHPFEFNHARFSEELERRGLNPRQLAIKMGRDPKEADRFYRWRMGDRSPKNRSEVGRVAAALELEPGDLMRDLEPGEGGKRLIGQPGGFNPFVFRAIMDGCGWPQNRVAQVCGVTQTTIAKWVRGEFSPGSKAIIKPFAKELGIDVEVFYP